MHGIQVMLCNISPSFIANPTPHCLPLPGLVSTMSSLSLDSGLGPGPRRTYIPPSNHASALRESSAGDSVRDSGRDSQYTKPRLPQRKTSLTGKCVIPAKLDPLNTCNSSSISLVCLLCQPN